MSNDTIASSTSASAIAVVGVKSVTISKGEQVSLGKSNIPSMTTGVEINNQLLPDLSQLIECIQKRSEKFPKIAELMALRDSQIKAGEHYG